jgi:hypothetical protein
MAETPNSAPVNLPDPPRLFNDWAIDGPAISQWFKDLVAASRQQSQTINSLAGSSGGSVDIDDLPDPASTNLAQAQQTANEAFINAAAAQGDADEAQATADSIIVYGGSVTITDAATTAVATFAAAQADTSYQVQVTLTGSTGTPDAGSTAPSSVTKATDKATVTVSPAPGVGNSVTFDVTVIRKPA